ncbi:MAG: hypothetical protein J3K34DRAFT_519270 [Monoraphidium minutum]|nr:MAG: hypothetical protein J3K34DRAFT_519270 [Monoraphidium minutum]
MARVDWRLVQSATKNRREVELLAAVDGLISQLQQLRSLQREISRASDANLAAWDRLLACQRADLYALLPLTAQRLEELGRARRAAATRAAALAVRGAEAARLLETFADVNRSSADEWEAADRGAMAQGKRALANHEASLVAALAAALGAGPGGGGRQQAAPLSLGPQQPLAFGRQSHGGQPLLHSQPPPHSQQDFPPQQHARGAPAAAAASAAAGDRRAGGGAPAHAQPQQQPGGAPQRPRQQRAPSGGPGQVAVARSLDAETEGACSSGEGGGQAGGGVPVAALATSCNNAGGFGYGGSGSQLQALPPGVHAASQ